MGFREPRADAGHMTGGPRRATTPKTKFGDSACSKTDAGVSSSSKPQSQCENRRPNSLPLSAPSTPEVASPTGSKASLATGKKLAAEVKPFVRRCGCLRHREAAALLDMTSPVRERSRSEPKKPAKSKSSTLGKVKTKSASTLGLCIRVEPTPGTPLRMRRRSFSEEVLIMSGDAVFFTYDINCCYECKQRYKCGMWCTPRLVPHHYSTSVVLKLNSTRKRFTDAVEFKMRLLPSRFTETVFTWPKATSTTYTTTLHQRGKKKLWYTSGVEFDYPTRLYDVAVVKDDRDVGDGGKDETGADKSASCQVLTLNGEE